jgi:hypothetical protein
MQLRNERTFPLDCWQNVISFVTELEDLISLSQVSKHLYSLSRQDTPWKNLYQVYSLSHWKYLNPATHQGPWAEDEDIDSVYKGMLDQRKKLSYYEQFKLFHR